MTAFYRPTEPEATSIRYSVPVVAFSGRTSPRMTRFLSTESAISVARFQQVDRNPYDFFHSPLDAFLGNETLITAFETMSGIVVRCTQQAFPHTMPASHRTSLQVPQQSFRRCLAIPATVPPRFSCPPPEESNRNAFNLFAGIVDFPAVGGENRRLVSVARARPQQYRSHR